MAMGTPLFKVILTGDYGVGKSALFRRFVDNSFTVDEGPKSTMGLDHYSKTYTIRGKEVQLELWDTAGIERFATLSSSYFHSASAAVLCYSHVNRESFNTLPQHLLEVIVNSKTAKVFLCATKSDLHSHDAISDVDVADFQTQCDAALSDTFRTSSKEAGHGVADMFYAIAETLIEDVEGRFRPKVPEEGDEAFKLHKKKAPGGCSC